MASAFYKCFNTRVTDMGLPCPETIFGTLAAATATIGAIAKAVATYGTEVTLGELIGAGIITGAVAQGISEVVGYVGALTASFYVGVCLGALSICTGEAIGGALSIYQMDQNFYNRTNANLSPDLLAIMDSNPEMLGDDQDNSFDVRLRGAGFGDFSSTPDNLSYA